jgi:hypothetical protein
MAIKTVEYQVVRCSVDELEDRLSAYGAEGWELAGTFPLDSHRGVLTLTLILMRREA